MIIRKAFHKESGVFSEVKSEEGSNVVRVALRAKDFIFSQASIVSSVMLEPNSHLINPMTSRHANSNGDTWSNESLKANYRSFIGAYNYINHNDGDSNAVGFLADAALRKIILEPQANISVYYVDILIATCRDFVSLVNKILSNQIEFMSMGCEAYASMCSKCGKVFKDDFEFCECLEFSKGKYFIDSEGVRRIIAEILGNESSGSCIFVEASWLSQVPAFDGAAKRHILAIPDELSVEIELPSDAMTKPAITKFIKN